MPKNKSLKIIIDTNLWIIFIISDKLKNLDELLFSKKIKLMFSEELVLELQHTFRKPKLEKYFVNTTVEHILEIFEDYIELIEVQSEISICRDPYDNFLLGLAKDSKADYLITGDKDLLEIDIFNKTKIINFYTFLNELKTFDNKK